MALLELEFPEYSSESSNNFIKSFYINIIEFEIAPRINFSPSFGQFVDG
jgi:hypothetical protein